MTVYEPQGLTFQQMARTHKKAYNLGVASKISIKTH